MTAGRKAKVVGDLTAVLHLIDQGKAQAVCCRRRGEKDMALLPYRHLQPVLHGVITDYGALVALPYDLLERMLDEAKVKLKSVVLDLDAAGRESRAAKRKRGKRGAGARTRKKAKVAASSRRPGRKKKTRTRKSAGTRKAKKRSKAKKRLHKAARKTRKKTARKT